MSALYELVGEYRAVQQQLEADNLDPQTIADTLDSIVGPVEDKIIAVAKVIRNHEIKAAAIREAEKVLVQRRKAAESTAASLSSYLLRNMASASVPRVERPDMVVAVHRNPPYVKVDDDSLVPNGYWRFPDPPPPELDRPAILAALKAGEVVPGAHLVTDGFRLSIK